MRVGSVHEADNADFEESRRPVRGDARVAVDGGDDQRSRERYGERLIGLEPQRHGDAEGAATAGNRPKTCGCVGAQLWLEDVDGRDDVVEICHHQIGDAERPFVGTSTEMNVVDGHGCLAEKWAAWQRDLDDGGLDLRRQLWSEDRAA